MEIAALRHFLKYLFKIDLPKADLKYSIYNLQSSIFLSPKENF